MIEGWQINNAPWALGVAGAFLIASVWFFFRSIKREGNTRGMIALHFLRMVIALAVAITFLRPERVLLAKRNEQPRVAVLWDASGSMATKDVVLDGKTAVQRAEWVKEQVEAKFWGPLEKRYQVSVEAFGAPATDTKADVETEIGTDLNGALERVRKAHTDLRAVLLLTDGDWNLGKSPITGATALAQKDVPVFALGTGSENYLPDLELQSVLAPTYGLLNERISVFVTLQNHLNREVKTTVTVSGPGGATGSKAVTIPPMAQIQDMVVITPTAEGEADFTVKVPVEKDEIFPENNEKKFHMAVRKETLKVLVVDSQPRWEFRYLRNALMRDPGVQVNTVLFHPQIGMGEGPGYLPSFPTKREDLQGYDVVFLGDVGVTKGMISPEQATMLRGLIEQQASGLVFLPGPLGWQRTLKDSPLGDLVPVETDYEKGAGMVNFSAGSGFSTAGETKLELTFRGRDHWLTMLATDPSANQAVWRGLPGFFWYAPVVKAKPGAEVLAVHESARNAAGRIPLLATRSAGSGKVLYMGTDSAWRWRKGVEDTYHYRFWSQVVRWMSHQRHLAQSDGMRFFYTPEAPKRGDKVRLSATVLDKLGTPITEGKVTVTLKAPGGTSETIELAAENTEWGVYNGVFTPREGGRYEVEVANDTAGRRMKTQIDVTVPTLEKVGLPAKLDVLREISALTGGKFASPGELAQVISSLSLLPERKPEELRFRLWCDPWWCGALLVLFSAYWIGRKIGGLV
ncbi:membrane protein [Verrucomicrobiota bacterium]|nr:membrane protein [Verrucomicrobiota bacterium]